MNNDADNVTITYDAFIHSNPQIDENGNKCWKNKFGKFHRADGPAVKYKNGNEEWWFNGKIHRLDGPAIEYFSGDKYWYYDGIRLDSIKSQKEFESWLNLKAFL